MSFFVIWYFFACFCTAFIDWTYEDALSSFTHGGKFFQILKASGPERITGAWWQKRNKTRDYFDVEDGAGQRFWIFKVLETGKWYLHGIFA